MRSSGGRGDPSSRAVDDKLARLLRQAGETDRTVDEYRVRQIGEAVGVGALSAAAVGVLLELPAVALVAAVAGFVVGLTRSRRRLEREVTDRAARIRLELYTVNQLLAMHLRTGAGPMQAVQRLVDRGHGAVCGELRDALTWIRSGMGEAAAFRRAAEITPEPNATRTYQLIAAGVERGVDLAGGLLALSEDLRDRAKRAATQGGRPPAGSDAHADDRDPRSDHVAVHRRAAALDRSRASMTHPDHTNLDQGRRR